MIPFLALKHFRLLMMFQLYLLKIIPVRRLKESTLISTKTHRKLKSNSSKSQFYISLEKFPLKTEAEPISAMMWRAAVTTPWTPVTPGGPGSLLWWPGDSLLLLRGHVMTSAASKPPWWWPRDCLHRQSDHFRRSLAVVSEGVSKVFEFE